LDPYEISVDFRAWLTFPMCLAQVATGTAELSGLRASLTMGVYRRNMH
jgi:hypothetical protein